MKCVVAHSTLPRVWRAAEMEGRYTEGGYPTENIKLCRVYQTERRATIVPLGSCWKHHHMCLFSFRGGEYPKDGYMAVRISSKRIVG